LAPKYQMLKQPGQIVDWIVLR